MVEEARSCTDCGGALPPGTDPCPACLLRLGLDAAGRTTVSTGRRTAVSIDELAPLFPQLEILDLLGEGGMGVVYRARQRKLERLVALKILSRELSADPAFAERFLREAQALARLQHPNIVSLHDFGEAGGHYFLVMEYADGLNLRQILHRGDLTPREALAIVPQICDGLQYAHDAGVIHRDIKPENVLVDRKGRVKITDFGLAKIVGQAGPSISLTGTGQVMGTPQYMAPEQLASSRDVDHRADIYSLGVVFYELLTGNLPRGRFDLPSRRFAVDVRLDEVVLRALEQEPDLRYQQARELKTDVAIATQDVASAPEPPRWRSMLRTFLLFTGAWVVAGFAFNSGPLALAFAALAFVAIGLVEARRGLRTGAGRVSNWRRAGGTAAASVLLAASFGLFYLAEVSRWERSSSGYVSKPQDPEELRRHGENALDELVDTRSVVPVLERSDMMDWPAIYRLRFAWIGAAVFLGLGILAVAGATGAVRPLERLGAPLARVFAPALLAAVAASGWTTIPSWFVSPEQLVPLASTVEVPGDVSAVSDKLYLALLEIGATVETRHFWSAGPPGAAHPSHELQLLAGQPESPFDRWKITWLGPKRTFPHWVLLLAGPTSGDRTTVRIDGGQTRSGTEDAARWQRLAKQLLARAGP